MWASALRSPPAARSPTTSVSRGSRGLLAAPGSYPLPPSTSSKHKGAQPQPHPQLQLQQPSPQQQRLGVDEDAGGADVQLEGSDGEEELVSGAGRMHEGTGLEVDVEDASAGLMPGMGHSPPKPALVSLSLASPPARRSLAPMHSSATLVDRNVVEEPILVPLGGKAAPASGALGSFMHVPNSRFDPLRPSPDNPGHWVGRCAV